MNTVGKLFAFLSAFWSGSPPPCRASKHGHQCQIAAHGPGVPHCVDARMFWYDDEADALVPMRAP